MDALHKELVERFTDDQRDAFFKAKEEGELEPPKMQLLHPELARAIREVGHTDMVLLADKGFPLPAGVSVVQLAVSPDVPTIPDVLDAMLSDVFGFDRLVVADEMAQASQERVDLLKAKYPETPIEHVPHEQFKQYAACCRLAIRTGDATPYANTIAVCG